MLKKTSTALKKSIDFFVDFSSIFRRKLMKNRVQSIKNSLARKNQQKSTFGTPFFSKKAIFSRFLGSLWVPGSLPRRPGGHPFFHRCSVGCENQPGPGPWRSYDFHFKSYGFHFKSYGFRFKPYVFHFQPYNLHFKSYGWYCFYAMLTPLSSLSQLNN